MTISRSELHDMLHNENQRLARVAWDIANLERKQAKSPDYITTTKLENNKALLSTIQANISSYQSQLKQGF